MSATKTYEIPASFKNAHITPEKYTEMYRHSIENPEDFWAEMAEQTLDWQEKWHTVSTCDFNAAKVAWFEGGRLNASVNCIDRHLTTRADQTAIIWEPNAPETPALHITYRELHQQVCKLANGLKEMGVKKGDRVCIYMPMVPQAAYAMLACARIGAIHSVVFAGFSAEALKNRIEDAGADVVITADAGLRGAKTTFLKQTVDEALSYCAHKVRHVLVYRHTGAEVPWEEGRDLWYHDLVERQPESCQAESMEAPDPLFILYTSGSTGKPKGVVHGTGGYLLYAALTHKYVFDYHTGDVYWCTADVGWVTGHSYIVYGPLANGATTVMYEGVPNFPDWGRFWQVVDRHKVNIFYTAPTAIRALHAQGDTWVKKHDRSSLKLLGTVGEPINPEVWEWYSQVVGEGRCPVVDTWWQTETGGILISPLPGATPTKPGSATVPFFGVQPVMLDEEQKEIAGPGEGHLCLKTSWPGQMQTVWGDHERFRQTYFATHPGYYFSGDGCRRDKDGYHWITGRVDDVLNVSGHRLGTAEIESALVLHSKVAEAAVVGFPHPIKGQGVYAYVTPTAAAQGDDALAHDLVALVRKEIGPIATIDLIQWAPDLPKTRSGKIMRRILRKVAAGDTGNLGDTSTLANPEVVEGIIKNRKLLPDGGSH